MNFSNGIISADTQKKDSGINVSSAADHQKNNMNK
jgi:hypothetical protein